MTLILNWFFKLVGLLRISSSVESSPAVFFGEENEGMLTEIGNQTEFSLVALKELSQDWKFYRYPSTGKRPTSGRFFARYIHQDIHKQNDGTYLFAIVAPYLAESDSPVEDSTMSSTDINQATPVTGDNPAEVVAKSHPQLIRHLLA
jgi:hypothetical protein